MNDYESDDRFRSGGQLVGLGVFVLVLSIIGTCGAVVAKSGSDNSAAAGFEIGQSPWLAIGLTIAIALIVLGQVRKSNARRAAKDRYLRENTEIKQVLDEEAPGGPFRADMKEVAELDPMVAAAEESEAAYKRRRGNMYLAWGGGIMTVTIVVMLYAMSPNDGESSRRAVERVMTSLGLAFFPFGFGLFLAIKGLILRN